VLLARDILRVRIGGGDGDVVAVGAVPSADRQQLDRPGVERSIPEADQLGDVLDALGSVAPGDCDRLENKRAPAARAWAPSSSNCTVLRTKRARISSTISRASTGCLGSTGRRNTGGVIEGIVAPGPRHNGPWSVAVSHASGCVGARELRGAEPGGRGDAMLTRCAPSEAGCHLAVRLRLGCHSPVATRCAIRRVCVTPWSE
jgi:hypothetical protein